MNPILMMKLKKAFPWILMIIGVIIVLGIWQNSNLLCQPDAEDQWLTALKFW